MRIAYIAAGAAGTYCGACARDTTLTRGLAARGHDIEFLSLYTPIRADAEPPGPCRIFYGGINVYLQQRTPLFRRTPRFLDRLFDSSWLLDFVERFAIDTSPEDLGEMTVSVLKGPEGRQAKELDRLLSYLASRARPDVVNITNSLLSAIAPAVKQSLNVPVVCNLQGEDVFVDRLGSPWRDEAADLIRRHAASVDAFVSPTEAYAAQMARYLSVDRSRISVIRPGVDAAVYAPSPERPPEPFRIGYLSLLNREKGLDLLCAAFRKLEAQQPGRALLSVAGEAVGKDRSFWEREMRKLRDAGLGDRVEYVGAPDLEGKIAFLRKVQRLSVPARHGQRQAVAALEAMATGCPVVLPDFDVEREIMQFAPGGVLVEPESVDELAAALARLRDNPEERESLGQRAAAGFAEHFSDKTMIEKTLDLYQHLAHA